MATIVDRPRSALNENPVTLQPRRRPSVVEVIDVDELEVPSSSNPSRSTSTQDNNSQSDTILVLDSDEEDVQVTRHITRPANRQRLISPPPPRAGPSRVPSVPPIPRRYSAFLSFTPPHHHRLRAVPSPPVVRPIAEPLPFEANLRSSPIPPPNALHSHPNRHRRIPYAATQPEPQSHHVPTLGLGGALISLNGETNNAPGMTAAAEHNFRRFYAALYRVPMDEQEDIQTLLARNLGIDVPVDPRRLETMYNNEYTHPDPSEPGFTHDFAAPELLPLKSAPIVIDLCSDDASSVAGPSSKPESPSATHNLLVCARCTDPLVLGGRLVGEERTTKKIWALRCGHMIDGKCLDTIGVPGRQSQSQSQLQRIEDANGVQDTSDKGKGKARANDDTELPLSPPLSPPTPFGNPIRSRLRSRVPPPPMPVPSSPSASATGSSRVFNPFRSTLGKRKRPAHPVPRYKYMYEWNCPVAGCGRVHTSVKIDGVWVPEPAKPFGKRKAAKDEGIPGRGVIAVFV